MIRYLSDLNTTSTQPSASADNAAAIEIPSDKTDASDRDDKDEPMAQSSTNMKKASPNLHLLVDEYALIRFIGRYQSASICSKWN